jgi:hypothetical protein
MSPTVGLLLMLVCAAIFYKAAQMDNAPRVLWPVLSMLLWVAASLWLEIGIVGCLLLQVGLLAAITGSRLLADRVRSRRHA